MAVYAILWQQILKKIPLITAYANKAVTVIWGLIWGMIIFNETIIVQKLVGAVVIVAGIVMVVKSDEQLHVICIIDAGICVYIFGFTDYS